MTVERIPLTQPIESRNGSFTKDSYSANCVFETRDGKREFVKRPGLVTATTIVSGYPGQGLVAFNGVLISVINNIVFRTNPTTYVSSEMGSISAIDNLRRIYPTRTMSGQTVDAYLFFHNKQYAYTIDQSLSAVSPVVNDRISDISVDNGGSRYSQAITLTFSAGGCVATPVVDSATGAITSVDITNKGSGLSGAPTITIVKPADASSVGTDVVASPYGFTVASASGIYVGMTVVGTGVVTGSTVQGVYGTTIVMDTAKSGPVSGTITFTDQGAGGVLTASLNSFPTAPYAPGAVTLDNYVFVAQSGTNRIYNSKLGDPLTWGALDFLTFSQTIDTLVGICKHLNYLVAFGQNSTQFYYDAGNPVGSPLLPAQSYTSEVGCASYDSVVATNNTVLWIGTSKTNGRAVYLMDGVSPIRVSTNAVDKFLEASNLTGVYSYAYKFNGHTLYILTLQDTNVTLVYDLDEKMWYTWTSYLSNAENFFDPCFFAEINAVPFCLSHSDGTLYYFDANVYQDSGQPIYCRTVTDIADNGSTHRKFYGRLEIIGDKVAGTMQISHSGNDYQSWSTPRSVDLSASRAQTYLGGSDRRRAWQFVCSDNVPLRLDSAEIDFRIGEMDQEQGLGGGRYRR